ncbi:CGNR zinc finger domain-containing protein [Dyella jiangningensis]|uniref:CGNR zinc finger domain-containing protein n=1 Tax=Dyella jiangningensis TaxID=1379159 RepID=UPI0024100922|nr:ABATE domain-containing protein [Dyella jiangningensis]MDG2536212.1 CGNR zinc finger domain-containing protein [Dyella jiangningensis]
MDALDLDPGDYGGTYKLVGGRPSLDFVNTISWPETEREHDWLSSPENARRWFAAVDLPFPRGKAVDLPALHKARLLLACVLRPLAHGEHIPANTIAELSRAVARAYQGRVIDPLSLAWHWPAPQNAADALAPILLDTAELVTAGDHERLRFCPSCDWLFEDHTRNGQRRWCDMADCGSRDKARRYYHRSKA